MLRASLTCYTTAAPRKYNYSLQPLVQGPKKRRPASPASSALAADVLHPNLISDKLALTLALQPGVGLGPFRLGHCLSEVLALVRLHRNSFRCVEVKYLQAQGLSHQDIAVSFPEHGFHLLFDGRQQRLRLIEVHDTTRLQVGYGGNVFGGAAHVPSFGRINEAFGPTWPGEAEAGQYPLQYPGIIFLFPLASPQLLPQQPQRDGAALGSRAAQLPVPLSSPAARIIIHNGTAASLAAARAAPPPPLPRASVYFETVEAVPCQGLLFTSGGQLLRFGDSPQDVVSELGEPSSTHTKPSRPGTTATLGTPLHLGGPGTGTGAGAAAGAAPDYYYCYAARGLDVLFCGSSHRAKKLVLHANPPGHPDFGLYSKCNFRVLPAAAWSLSGSCGASGGSGGSGGSGDDAADSPHYAASAASDGASSMKTAASESSSLAVTEVGVQHGPSLAAGGSGGGGAAGLASGPTPVAAEGSGPGVAGQQQQGQARREQEAQQREQEQEREQGQQASGLAAAYNMIVGLIDDVIHLDPPEDSSTASAEASGAAPGDSTAAADAGNGSSGAAAGQGATAAAAAALGRPPRPPTAVPIPAPLPTSSSSGALSKSSKKKAKKKEKARVAAAAAAKSGGAGASGDESATDADTDAFADSAPSSLASSPGMTSFLSNIAASGGTTAAAPAGPSGLSSGPASSADCWVASKERRPDCGSAYDGWSEGEELSLLVGEHLPAGTSSAADAAAGGKDFATAMPPLPGPQQQQQGGQQQQQGGGGKLRVSTAVQTAPAPDAEANDGVAAFGGAALSAAAAGRQLSGGADGANTPHSPESPESYVLADSPQLFDESAAAAEYESVPSQRSSGTQTQPHLLSGPPLHSGGAGTGAAGPHRRPLGASAAGGAAATAGVGVDGCLADIQTVFGRAAKPALHTRLGGRHPFGPTHLYAFRGVVFEVLHSGSLATVTLFEA